VDEEIGEELKKKQTYHNIWERNKNDTKSIKKTKIKTNLLNGTLWLRRYIIIR